MLKILIISNLYDPYKRGGAEKIVKLISNNLKKKHKLYIITSKPYKNFKSLFLQKHSQNNLSIYRFFPLNIFYYLNDYKYHYLIRFIWRILDIFNIHSYFIIKKIIKRIRPDIVLTHNLVGIGGLTIKAIKNFNIPIMHTIHDSQLLTPSGLIIYEHENDYIHTNFFTNVYKKINKYLYKNIDVIISPSKFLLNLYNKNYFFTKSRKIILPNPIKPKKTQKKETADYKQILNLMYVGQIEKHKGIKWLLDFIVQFRKKYYKFPLQLNVIGSGKLLKNLKTIYNRYYFIKFLGLLDNESLYKKYFSADYLIVPSLCYENQPTVILEAMNHGLPVIASSIGGIPELIKSNYNGYLFEPKNKNELENILKYVFLLRREKYRLLMKNALNESRKYNLSSFINKLEEIIYSICDLTLKNKK